ncbi:hypothetical protein [Phyllobacterium zundukense]|uniref:Uncharacterized protein n=1 Tax=Phyllobacterium zundukense TaxID=1867719 RepID=A0ACD4D598_9HYPH|nr:hypothetical protein [Phyllobacterium zundukense]UXN60910.1 hypothetical protein N8E88_31400 [Phyllobacterium zundukense]
MADKTWEQAALELKLEMMAVEMVCGYLLAKEAFRHPDPKAALMQDTGILLGKADQLAAQAGGVSQPITEGMERICANAEAIVTGK